MRLTRRLVRDEAGFTLVELFVVMSITLVLLAGLANMFSSGMSATSKTSAALASQENLIVAVNRLEFEGRCASAAALVSSGAGVTLTLPAYCVNAVGTYTWCVTSGSLIRYSGSSCSGTGVTFASSVTSTTPFTCVLGGRFPRLSVALTSNTGPTSGSAATGTTTITLRNATTSGSCA
jgi:Tfp pilus assembly protein PilW